MDSPPKAKTGLSQELKECQSCKRRFSLSRISFHEELCKRNSKDVREPFDPHKRALMEDPLISKSQRTDRAERKYSLRTDWRRQSEALMQEISLRKELFLKSGKPENALPIFEVELVNCKDEDQPETE